MQPASRHEYTDNQDCQDCSNPKQRPENRLETRNQANSRGFTLFPLEWRMLIFKSSIWPADAGRDLPRLSSGSAALRKQRSWWQALLVSSHAYVWPRCVESPKADVIISVDMPNHVAEFAWSIIVVNLTSIASGLHVRQISKLNWFDTACIVTLNFCITQLCSGIVTRTSWFDR